VARPSVPIAAKIGALDEPENSAQFAARLARMRALWASRPRMARPCRCARGALQKPVGMRTNPQDRTRCHEVADPEHKKRRAFCYLPKANIKITTHRTGAHTHVAPAPVRRDTHARTRLESGRVRTSRPTYPGVGIVPRGELCNLDPARGPSRKRPFILPPTSSCHLRHFVPLVVTV